MSDLYETERQRLADAAIDACWAESDVTGQVAAAWFGPVFRGDGADVPTAEVIAALVGLDVVTARREMTRMRAIARQVAREESTKRREKRRE